MEVSGNLNVIVKPQTEPRIMVAEQPTPASYLTSGLGVCVPPPVLWRSPKPKLTS